MSAWRLLVLPQAERDVLALGERLEFVAGRRVAQSWVSAVERAVLTLGDNPYLGAESDLIGQGRRRLLLRPYIIVYRITPPDTVTVVRVVDGRRDLPVLFSNSED